jgi:hypothetical protein
MRIYALLLTKATHNKERSMTDPKAKPKIVDGFHMKANERVNMHRRKFLLSSSVLLSATAVLESCASLTQPAPESLPAASPKGPVLLETLTPEELVIVKGSAMSEDMQNFWGKGYSCAETGLMVALRHMKKPEDLVWAATGFGGGMGQQDLCGFLTSGIIAIGLHAGDLEVERSEAKKLCGEKVREYWTWWLETAPLHCSEIREGRQGFNVCNRIGRLAAVKLESLLKA